MVRKAMSLLADDREMTFTFLLALCVPFPSVRGAAPLSAGTRVCRAERGLGQFPQESAAHGNRSAASMLVSFTVLREFGLVSA
ncbi:MAG TPA: hypothetical protein VMK12_06140 [Anaeromyxobacteraceae bacterium]|nr:hypothetical protein [Anaeromyxobacteraceae bacterium]